ncbi:SEC14-like protein 2 [Orchesella cincta]|uniref:SEC14-like protein 2 n=1 Tax=Orchesella cincta TaxID=48709 RepID=A0A1D2MES4_ORCCI|nr:SEC14-like protein 2 [Orchesella cincta]
MQITMKYPIFLVAILSVTLRSWLVSGVSVEEDLTLTASQKRALDRFKAKVINKLPENFMKQDIYLIRFLRAKSFDVNMAENLLLDDIKWRKENSISRIHEEDFSDVEEDYKAYVESFDREGKPIITANFGDWDIRKAVISGRMRRLEHYIDRTFEIATRKVRQLQAQGKNVTQWDYIINMNNYNVLQHGCVPCLPFYIYLVNSYEKHFPGNADKIMLINTPPVFEVVLSVIRPLMSPLTRRALKVYNQDKSQWQPQLFKYVSPSELPPEYGGTKIYTGDFEIKT